MPKVTQENMPGAASTAGPAEAEPTPIYDVVTAEVCGAANQVCTGPHDMPPG